MRIEQNYSLENHHTFRLTAKTRWFMEYDTEEELSRILQDGLFRKHRFLSIGEGSNMLFINDFNGIILHSCIRKIAVTGEDADSVLLRVGAGVHWDDVVVYAVANGWGGIENLSYIPGETGAAAVQNIGAYGVEIKDVIETVEATHPLTGKKHLFTQEACRYSYRHSFFI
jgi:UDP-N-acetylmuramate dehydrogenase